MAIKRYKDWRQFYIIFRDGREENYGKPKMLSVPKKTNAWKELLRIRENDEVKGVGWRTVKQSNLPIYS
jgi:hypothetical protein